MANAMGRLLEFQRQTEALEQVGQLLSWDQETFMPSGAAEQRAEWIGAIQGIIHSRIVSDEFAELLGAACDGRADATESAHLRVLGRERELARRIPDPLPSRIAAVSSRAITAWQEARRREEVGLLLPLLDELVKLKREEANALADNCRPYDALLDTFEQGATSDWIDQMFGRLRVALVDLTERIFASGRPVCGLTGEYPEPAQMELSRELATLFGYDWEKGRLDKSVHPFTSGAGNDVRITTRVDTTSPFNCLYATIHEAGHACYEQRIRKEYLLTPLGKGASFGVHESQSRILENQLGRSRAFCSWLFGRMRDVFGSIGVDDAVSFYAAANRVTQCRIRTEADEVQYNLHIMLRYSLERDLINGQIEVRDLEEAWNQRFLENFGLDISSPSEGILQDIHWPAGLFGYFPTYTIGNIYASALHSAMRENLPGLDEAMKQGNLMPAIDWLETKVQQFGRFHEPRKLIEQASGQPVSEEPLLRYLEDKFGEIYEV